ncbi:MAG: right-handed parallel beta-helix repeat-containing protein, partial [Bacteroidales bacterium]|nr:right-handed parallel beta-helix repeat-containing protein [Bacteroidales bacterium]
MKRLFFIVLSFITLNTSLSARSWADIDVTRDEYYVTVKGTTDGDGSSWDMAISSDEFSYVLPNAKKGAIFHLAAGEYNPILDSTLNVPSNGQDPYRTFLIRKPVTIIGGYPEKPKKNDVSDPAKYITLLNADVKRNDIFDKETGQRENCEEDLRCAVIVSMVESGNCLLKGLKFEGGAPRAGRWDHDGTLEIIGRDNVDATVHVDSCTFYKCNAAFSLFNGNLNVSNSIFQECGGTFERFIGNVTINSCSFKNVGIHVYMYSDSTYPITSSLKLINNTILDALSFDLESVETSSKASCEMINNTVLNVDRSYIRLDNLNLKMIGNIFMSKNFELITSMGAISSRYNIYNIESEDEYVSQYFSRYDHFLDVDNYLEKTEDGSNYNLQNNGGYTPTVKMIRDEISSAGEKIILRFNDLGENLTVDQRGVSRGRKKCMGAYEMPCETEYSKTLVTETIQCGEKFHGKQYDLPGVYDTLYFAEENRLGCDSIVPYRLNVLPETFLKEYYVKENGEGDGSDWDHAMGVETFDFMLRNVPDGTKFYIAAGEYQPVRDEYGNVPAEKDILSKRFYTEKIVSLYGGFPATATGTDKTNDPAKYRTVFSGDLGHDNPSTFSKENEYADFRKNDLSYILRMLPKSSGDIELKGITFANVYQSTREGSYVVDIFCRDEAYEVNCTISECTICQGNQGLDISGCSAEIKDCYFKDIYSSAAYVSSINNRSNLIMTRSTIENGSMSISSRFNVNNCTFQLESPVSIYVQAISGVMANNTIMSDVSVMCKDVKFVGNIINGVITAYGDGKFTTSYNLISAANEDITVAKTDVKADAELILGVLDQKGAKTSDNGGLTPTIALLSDTLSDGRSIRLPLSETTVTEDQRGVKRLDPTSMGAVEMGCTTIKKSVVDTIVAGKSFLSKVYNKPGIYEGIVDTTEDANGCELIVTYTLVVKPNPSVKEYYVKVKGEGDGSNWDEAMNGADFAFVFPQVPDGTKFYLAEGEYQPIYNSRGAIPAEKDSLDKRFYTESLVSLYGGFPDTATGTNKNSDPKKCITLFNGDLGHDNPSTVSKEDEYADFRKNDVGFILQMYLRSAGNIEIKGITFANARQYSREGSSLVGIHYYSEKKDINCEISECTFSRGDYGLNLGDLSGEIKDCYFVNNYYTAFSIYNKDGSKITVTRSTFESNERNPLTVSGEVNVNNCTFTEGAVGFYFGASGVMANNTIMNDVILNVGSDVKFVGNILNGVITADGSLTTSYNLISAANEELAISKTDVKADSVIIVGVLDGTKPKANGGFTSTIALLSDTLSDGRSIRLPLAETTVTEDQRGVKRLDPTSMGAVEMGCVSRETSVTDTIIAGETFLTKEYNKAGIYEGVVDTTEDANGCELIVTHKLVVKPN